MGTLVTCTEALNPKPLNPISSTGGERCGSSEGVLRPAADLQQRARAAQKRASRDFDGVLYAGLWSTIL